MTQQNTDPRIIFTSLFGEAAPVVPTTAEGFYALGIAQQMRLRESAPAWTQSIIGDTASLPPAVSLRRDAGEMTPADIPALRAAGLLAEAEMLQQGAAQAALQSFSQAMEQERTTRETHSHADTNSNTQARLASMAAFGRVEFQ